jgi:hypothetical protein
MNLFPPDGRTHGGKFEEAYKKVFIAVMGVTGSGKSSFIKLCCESEVEVGHGLQACKFSPSRIFLRVIRLPKSYAGIGTSNVSVYPWKYNNSTTIYLVDTPGFDDTNRSDTDVLYEIADWLKISYEYDVQLSGIIYLHRISDPRMQGSAKRNLVMFKKLCGDNALRNVILGTTMWDKVQEAEGCRREEELAETPDFWGWMLSKGSVMLRHENNRTSALALVDRILNRNSTVILELQEELVGAHKPLSDTGVGRELKREIERERERYKQELAQVRAEMEESRKKRDSEMTADLEDVKKELKGKIEKGESELNKLQRERWLWNREREELVRKVARLAAVMPAAPYSSDTDTPKTQSSLPLTKVPWPFPGWTLDPIRKEHYYLNTGENAYIYESGERISLGSGDAPAEGSGPSSWWL